MDYEFKKNILDGNYYCHCSMGHEIVGRWLQEEIGKESTKIAQVLALIVAARSNPTEELCLNGTEISLMICGDEVTVQDNALLHSYELEAESEFELYDCESVACCGLEDFEQLIQQWQLFVRR
ncbi:TPA: YacL family protein [Vibrio vulnificus]|uniref:YacL family protein n=1 Tax=Vibrio vulnificus TaxID=672 RepID=UPI001CCE1265|nr:YacL family protein [Vibrio vulnificus]MCA0760543.1 YacL family protein [Vibrio vulnificus]HDY7727907.1 YacL family protein [Vibrio vulnificus]